MIQPEYKYNDKAHYSHGNTFQIKKVDIVDQNIIVKSDGNSFKICFQNLLKKCTLGISLYMAPSNMELRIDVMID